MTISGSKYARTSVGSLVLLLFLVVTIVYSQAVHSPFGPVPEDKRPLLAERLQAYTTNFHDGNWGTLYGLVSDADKIRLDGKTMVSKDTFIQAMQRTHEMRHLLKLVPARTEARHLGLTSTDAAKFQGAARVLLPSVRFGSMATGSSRIGITPTHSNRARAYLILCGSHGLHWGWMVR